MATTNAQIKQVTDTIAQQMPGKGYAVILFDAGEVVNPFKYASNGVKEDMIVVLESLVKKMKNQLI